MRTARSLRTPLVVSILAIGGIVASAGVSSAAAPPSDPVDIDLDQLAEVLTPEQITCIGTQFTPDLASDANAAIQVLTDCGVSMDQLVSLVPGGEVADPVSSSEVGSDDGAADPAAVAAVLAAAGLDATDLTCITAGLDAAVTGDDDEALTILQGCGISLAEILQGLVSVGGDAPVPAVDTPATTAATAATTAAGADPVNDAVASMLESMGLELNADQINCLTQAVSAGGVDTADTGSLMTLLSDCGISLTDLMSSS